MTVCYMTNDTCGIGGFGPIPFIGQDVEQPHPSRADQAMMRCSAIEADEFQQFFEQFRQLSTKRRQAPQGEGGKNLRLGVVDEPNRGKVLQVMQPDGIMREVARSSGEIRLRDEYEMDVYMEDQTEEGTTRKVPGALLTVSMSSEVNGVDVVNVMFVKLPSGEIVKIGEAKGNVGFNQEIFKGQRFDEVMPDGRCREIAKFGREEYEKYGIPLGSEPKGDIDN